jgi:hypothetical protein
MLCPRIVRVLDLDQLKIVPATHADRKAHPSISRPTAPDPERLTTMPDGSATAHLYRPKFVTVLTEGYNLGCFRRDITAALTVAIVALPLSMAIAVASGVPPARGLYAAVVGGFLVSALGGSRYQIGGPAGAGAQVGTVDKFQGQEAAIVIVSMTTSKGTEAPRGTEFLFNPNRFNVAVSRAECLAVVVHGAELLEGAWTKIDDLRRLNLFAHAEAVGYVAPDTF